MQYYFDVIFSDITVGLEGVGKVQEGTHWRFGLRKGNEEEIF